MELSQIVPIVAECVRETGLYIASQRKTFQIQQVEIKSFNQLVSYVDREAEMQLAKKLSSIIPEAGFITEEETQNQISKQWNWIIDPLDGTTNFIHDLPIYSVSVGLMFEGVLKAGWVFHVPMDEMFYAWENGGAFLNEKPIKVAKNQSIQKALMATGFPYYDFKGMIPYLEVLKKCMQHSHGLRRMGSAAIDLAYVAAGRFDGFFEYGLNPWDVAGGALLIKEAGGIVTDFNGKDDYVFGKTIIAASPQIVPELISMIQEEFNRHGYSFGKE